MRSLATAIAAALVIVGPAFGQSVLERSPNIQGTWGVEKGNAAFIFSHRFEVASGGDELTSFPTLTLAAGLPLGLTLGLDYTSYSEVIPDNITGNEAQFWLKRPFGLGRGHEVAVLAGYNHAAESFDGALDVRATFGRIQVFGEGRAFSDLFGSGDAAAAGAVGLGLQLTRYLAVTGDIGRVLTEDTVPSAWSAAIAIQIPSTPHSLSLQVSNSGATTLQGASRKKTVGSESVRYGFALVVPLHPARFAEIFAPVPVVEPATAGATLVEMRDIAFGPREVTIRQGETVEWINADPVAHTVTAVDRSWDSGTLADGERYRRTFTQPGRYEYFCVPHPGMRGTVVVTP